MSSATRRETRSGETRSENDDRLREVLVQDEFVHEMICRRAYEIYQDRGCEDGHAREDWLQAEREILDGLIGQARAGRLEVVLAEYAVVSEQLSGGPPRVSDGLTGLHAAAPEAPYPDRYYNPHPEVFEDFVPLAAETISFQAQAAPVAVAIPEATRYVEHPSKKLEETPKSEKPRKHKKAAAAAEESLTMESEKAKKKKAGHKSKDSKSKDSKSKQNKKK
jgi:hypothetical protein